MNRAVLILVLTLSLIPAFGQARADTITLTFDDINANSLIYNSVPVGSVPSNYRGLNWSNLYVISNSTYRSKYANFLDFSSNTNALFNGRGQAASISSSTTFDLLGGMFSSWTAYSNQYWYGATTLTITGQRQGVVVGSSVISLSPGAMTNRSLSLVNVDTVQFLGSGGSNGNWWLADNLKVSLHSNALATPEPATLAYMCLGLLGMAAFRRNMRVQRDDNHHGG